MHSTSLRWFDDNFSERYSPIHHNDMLQLSVTIVQLLLYRWERVINEYAFDPSARGYTLSIAGEPLYLLANL